MIHACIKAISPEACVSCKQGRHHFITYIHSVGACEPAIQHQLFAQVCSGIRLIAFVYQEKTGRVLEDGPVTQIPVRIEVNLISCREVILVVSPEIPVGAARRRIDIIGRHQKRFGNLIIQTSIQVPGLQECEIFSVPDPSHNPVGKMFRYFLPDGQGKPTCRIALSDLAR